jgi:hypothetical protein
MNRRAFGGLAGAFLFIGLILALVIQPFNLPIFFAGIAASILVGALASPNPQGIYGGVIGAMWVLMLALFFLTGSWLWFLVGVVLSMLLGSFARPIMAGIRGSSFYNQYERPNQPPQQYYQPTQQPYQSPQQQPYQSYQQGYQAPPAETYQEGNQNYSYPAQGSEYEQPQPQYPPQEMPPPTPKE